MADTRELQVVITAKDEASRVLQNLGSSFGNLVKESQGASLAFAGALTVTGKKIIDIASDMEQAKVAFTVFLGSSDAASKSLSDLSDFAKKTPFTFPGITEAARRLLAYNVEAKDLIPTLTMLGNISAGVGTEKLPQLILAFGQMKAATKLTGMELRQFSEAGVPLLTALVNQANEAGGVLTKMGGASKETTKKVSGLASGIAEANFKMQYLKENGKEGSKEFQNLGEKVKYSEARIASFGDVGQAVYVRVKQTAKDMIQNISDGNVTFEEAAKALEKMTQKGGRFYQLMEEQSKTFGGATSNIQDQLTRIALRIAGISTEAKDFGRIIEGGPFDLLKKQAFNLLEQLNALEPRVNDLFKAFMANSDLVAASLGVLAGALIGAAFWIASFLAPILILAAIGGAVGVAISTINRAFQEQTALMIGLTSGLATFVGILTGLYMPTLIALIAKHVALAASVIAAYLPYLLIAGAVAALSAAMAFLILNTDLLKTKEDLVKESTMNLKFAKEQLKTSTESLIDAENRLNGAFTSLEGAQLAVERATKTADETAKKYGITSLENREAQHNLKVAQDALKEAQDRVNKATFEAINKSTDYIKAQNDVKSATDKLEEANKRSETSFGRIKSAIDGVIGSFTKWLGMGGKGGSGGGGSFQHGGFIPGPYNQAVPAVLHGGERVIPRNGTDVNQSSGGGGAININFSGPVTMDSEERINDLAQKIASYLGRQNELAARGMSV